VNANTGDKLASGFSEPDAAVPSFEKLDAERPFRWCPALRRE
jgi:hypothetical protein